MKLTAPKITTFWLALLVAVIGVASHLGYVPNAQGAAFWILALGFLLMALGVALRGL